MKNFNCPKCYCKFYIMHKCNKYGFGLKWYNGYLYIALLRDEYYEYKFSCPKEEAQEKINKFIDNLIFI